MSTARIPKSRLAGVTAVVLLVAFSTSCGGDATGPVRPPEQSCPTVAAPICDSDERADVERIILDEHAQHRRCHRHLSP